MMDEYERAEALTRAWQRTQDARRSAKRWKAKAQAAGAEAHAMRAALSAADALVNASCALPDVVKTKALLQALSKYRKARETK